jgi:hypothetical protein
MPAANGHRTAIRVGSAWHDTTGGGNAPFF